MIGTELDHVYCSLWHPLLPLPILGNRTTDWTSNVLTEIQAIIAESWNAIYLMQKTVFTRAEYRYLSHIHLQFVLHSNSWKLLHINVRIQSRLCNFSSSSNLIAWINRKQGSPVNDRLLSVPSSYKFKFCLCTENFQGISRKVWIKGKQGPIQLDLFWICSVWPLSTSCY